MRDIVIPLTAKQKGNTMPRLIRRRPLRWGAIAGAAGALLLAAVALTGCPGDIDPSIKMPLQGTGGSGSGTGGTSGGGDCTGGNSGDQIIATTCAVSGCHTGGTVSTTGAGLDLTLDSGLQTRLVGVMSSGSNIFSLCNSVHEAYLNDNSDPATGLLIDKINSSPPCGVQMPQIGAHLTADQINCVVQWATTLTSQ
jgi:hypothetical protein